tara:strand:- start:5294 stop:7132 length:1839 start_codon:yes stop_codon:yes gene_type:complete
MTNSLNNKIKQIPRNPGVYLFKNESGKILYIGKARVLRGRVRSYFQKSSQHSPKTISLMVRVSDVEWIVTGTEVEALITEANLIKEYKPKYNIDLKDDKSFPYIRITKEPYPQVLLTRKVIKDGSKYFGPFTDVRYLRETLKVVHKVFPVRSCSYFIDQKAIDEKKIMVCLDYHIKKCEGPCEGLVSENKYNRNIQSIIGFLHGKSDHVLRGLREKMKAESGEMNYENAAIYRDQINAVEKFTQRQRKISSSFEDKDIIAIAVEEGDACAVVMRIRSGKIIGREKVFLAGVDTDEIGSSLSAFIQNFYLETDFIPPSIQTFLYPENHEFLNEWLTEKMNKIVTIHVPQRGENVRLVRLSMKNAELLLGEYMRRKEKRLELVSKSLLQLQDDLRLSVPPRRIEAFDISNIQGTNPVASMVCFVDGKPKKSEYRKFNIKTVKGIDDFAMMREVVLRRYRRLKSEKAQFPDLILIDGGKGQLSMAVSALQELGLTYIPAAGLAKRLEEVFLPGFSEPQNIPKTSPGLFILKQVRDEAHRFAVAFHRQKRGKEATSSIFDDIKGVGPKTRKKLLTAFDDVQTIAKLDVKKIIMKTGIPIGIAKQILTKAKSFVSSQ